MMLVRAYLGRDRGRGERMLERARKRLDKRARKGFRGYPVATVALHGPDDTMATKLTVGIVPAENAEVADLRRWFSEGSEIRDDVAMWRKKCSRSSRPLELSRS